MKSHEGGLTAAGTSKNRRSVRGGREQLCCFQTELPGYFWCCGYLKDGDSGRKKAFIFAVIWQRYSCSFKLRSSYWREKKVLENPTILQKHPNNSFFALGRKLWSARYYYICLAEMGEFRLRGTCWQSCDAVQCWLSQMYAQWEVLAPHCRLEWRWSWTTLLSLSVTCNIAHSLYPHLSVGTGVRLTNSVLWQLCSIVTWGHTCCAVMACAHFVPPTEIDGDRWWIPERLVSLIFHQLERRLPEFALNLKIRFLYLLSVDEMSTRVNIKRERPL